MAIITGGEFDNILIGGGAGGDSFTTLATLQGVTETDMTTDDNWVL